MSHARVVSLQGDEDPEDDDGDDGKEELDRERVEDDGGEVLDERLWNEEDEESKEEKENPSDVKKEQGGAIDEADAGETETQAKQVRWLSLLSHREMHSDFCRTGLGFVGEHAGGAGSGWFVLCGAISCRKSATRTDY